MRTITVDRLSGEEMQRVRDYLLTSELNEPHTGSDGELYGDYVKVNADIQGDPIDKNFSYRNIVFQMGDIGIECEYTEKRKVESREVVDGLMKLLSDFAVS